MGSLRGETTAVRRQVSYTSPGNPITARRREPGETSLYTVNSGFRPGHPLGGVDGGTQRQQRLSSSSSSTSDRLLQFVSSPSAGGGGGLRPTAVRGLQTTTATNGAEHGLQAYRGVNGWSQSHHADVLAVASDTEVTSPDSPRRRRQQTNDDLRWPNRLYISASDLRHNSSGHRPSSRSSTSGRESTSGSILKKRQDDGKRLERNGSCSSSSTIVSPIPDKYEVSSRPSGEVYKGRGQSRRVYSDSSAASSSQNSRRVGFKNNVAVYRFDSDGEDSAGYSSTVSETSEQLDGNPRPHRHHSGHGGRQPQPTNGHRPISPAASQDAAASWAAARGWSSAADRVGSPRYAAADGYQERHYHVADDVPPSTRLNSNSTGSARQQLATISRSLYVDDCDDDGSERQTNGSAHPAAGNHTWSQRQLAPDESWVLSCGSITVHNPLCVDCAHYDYIQTEKDFARRLVLTCGLKHVNHFDPDRLVVKANRSGTRARVVFGGDTNRRSDVEPSDQLLLPFAVDSYSLTAQLLADNSLVIEAPVLQ